MLHFSDAELDPSCFESSSINNDLRNITHSESTKIANFPTGEMQSNFVYSKHSYSSNNTPSLKANSSFSVQTVANTSNNTGGISANINFQNGANNSYQNLKYSFCHAQNLSAIPPAQSFQCSLNGRKGFDKSVQQRINLNNSTIIRQAANPNYLQTAPFVTQNRLHISRSPATLSRTAPKNYFSVLRRILENNLKCTCKKIPKISNVLPPSTIYREKSSHSSDLRHINASQDVFEIQSDVSSNSVYENRFQAFDTSLPQENSHLLQNDFRSDVLPSVHHGNFGRKIFTQQSHVSVSVSTDHSTELNDVHSSWQISNTTGFHSNNLHDVKRGSRNPLNDPNAGQYTNNSFQLDVCNLNDIALGRKVPLHESFVDSVSTGRSHQTTDETTLHNNVSDMSMLSHQSIPPCHSSLSPQHSNSSLMKRSCDKKVSKSLPQELIEYGNGCTLNIVGEIDVNMSNSCKETDKNFQCQLYSGDQTAKSENQTVGPICNAQGGTYSVKQNSDSDKFQSPRSSLNCSSEILEKYSTNNYENNATETEIYGNWNFLNDFQESEFLMTQNTTDVSSDLKKSPLSANVESIDQSYAKQKNQSVHDSVENGEVTKTNMFEDITKVKIAQEFSSDIDGMTLLREYKNNEQITEQKQSPSNESCNSFDIPLPWAIPLQSIQMFIDNQDDSDSNNECNERIADISTVSEPKTSGKSDIKDRKLSKDIRNNSSTAVEFKSGDLTNSKDIPCQLEEEKYLEKITDNQAAVDYSSSSNEIPLPWAIPLPNDQLMSSIRTETQDIVVREESFLQSPKNQPVLIELEDDPKELKTNFKTKNIVLSDVEKLPLHKVENSKIDVTEYQIVQSCKIPFVLITLRDIVAASNFKQQILPKSCELSTENKKIKKNSCQSKKKSIKVKNTAEECIKSKTLKDVVDIDSRLHVITNKCTDEAANDIRTSKHEEVSLKANISPVSIRNSNTTRKKQSLHSTKIPKISKSDDDMNKNINFYSKDLDKKQFSIENPSECNEKAKTIYKNINKVNRKPENPEISQEELSSCSSTPAKYYKIEEKNSAIYKDKVKSISLKTAYPCVFCERVLTTARGLKEHYRTHTDEKPFSCDFCDRSFRTKKLLNYHSKTHTENKLNPDEKSVETKKKSISRKKAKSYQCVFCERVLTSSRGLREHYTIHTNEKPYSCEFCQRTFRTVRLLRCHYVIHRDDEIVFDNNHDIQSSEEINAENKKPGFRAIKAINGVSGYKIAVKKFECPICKYVTYRSSTFKEHYRIHTGEKPYSCCVCNRSFYTARLLREHSYTHKITPTENSKQLENDDDKEKLDDENKNGESVKPKAVEVLDHSCPICGKKYRNKGTLKTHISRHKRSTEKHECKICGCQLSNGYSLNQHLRMHTGEKPYVCVVCNSKFRTSGMLRYHSMKHNPKKRYSCKSCGKSYNVKWLYTQHMNLHRIISDIKCDICDKNFNFKANLAQHMLVHSNIRKHQCETCGMKFKLPHHLRSHLETHH